MYHLPFGQLGLKVVRQSHVSFTDTENGDRSSPEIIFVLLKQMHVLIRAETLSSR
jgi:hypothetical protein